MTCLKYFNSLIWISFVYLIDIIMKNIVLRNVLWGVIVVSLLSFDTPTAWFKAGSRPNSYEMEIVKGVGLDGKNVATIKSIEKK